MKSMVSVKPTTTTDTTGNQTTTAGIYIAGYNNYGQLYTKNAVSRTNLTKVQRIIFLIDFFHTFLS